MIPQIINSVNLNGKRFGGFKTILHISEHLKRNNLVEAQSLANKFSFVKFLPRSLISQNTIYPNRLSEKQVSDLKSCHDKEAHAYRHHGLILKDCGNFDFKITHRLGLNTSPIPMDLSGDHYCNGLCIHCATTDVKKHTPLIAIVDLPIDADFRLSITKDPVQGNKIHTNKLDIKSIVVPTSVTDLLRLNINPERYLLAHREDCVRELLIGLVTDRMRKINLRTRGLALSILYHKKDPMFKLLFEPIVVPMGGIYPVAEMFLTHVWKDKEFTDLVCGYVI
jgi:hypothetical protein